MTIQHHFAVRYPDLTIFPTELDDKIAVHGLHLRTQKDIQVGEQVGIQFRFPQREDPLKAAGVVAWISAQPDEQGKRSFVVKNLQFDHDAVAVLDLVRSTPAVEEAELTGSRPVPPPPPIAATEPVPAPAPPAPAPSVMPPVAETSPPVDSDEAGEQADEEPDRKKLFIALGVTGVLLVGLLTWLFAFNGLRWIAMNFLAPPEAATIAMRNPASSGPEPPLPGKSAPAPPKKTVVLPAVATSFDYFQRPAENEFIITFNKPVGKVVTSRVNTPLMQTFYIERAKVRLDKDQYFLPFEIIRTVSFEEESGVLKINMLSQHPHYLPDPVWEKRGRELNIRFIATD